MTEVVLVDTNVLLDLFTDDPQWRSWPERALADALMTDGVGINQWGGPGGLDSSRGRLKCIPLVVIPPLPLQIRWR